MPDIEEKVKAMWLQKIIDMIKGKPTIWKTLYTYFLGITTRELMPELAENKYSHSEQFGNNAKKLKELYIQYRREYTEYDPSDSDSSIDFAVPSPKKKKTTNPIAKVSDIMYQCPVCDKTLKTISGFRGHTSKQHGQQLRASDVRVTKGVSATKSSTSLSCEFSQVSKDTFSKTFYTVLPTSLCNIANDPFVVNPHEIKDLSSTRKQYIC
ncbi:ATBF1 [Mytilus coruscus]|uniref:ATBF1 n=1 Tax=Mytilus coruscus TaxID=42192 RepID=A0A6J8AVU2_MYTCO|nr:ATBF1 [Mytilus coruscus]